VVAAEFGSALELVDGVEGWLTDAQARRLWDAARRVRAPAKIVEIGSFRGRSAIVLASAAQDGVEVVAIDPHAGGDRGPREIAPEARRGEEDFHAFHANLERAGVAGRVRHVRAPSQAALGAVDGAVGMLYVDAAHRYQPARADLEAWGARVMPGGSMLVHDAFNAVGVTLAQMRLLFVSRRWRYVGRTGSLAEYRGEGLTAPRRMANALRQAASLSYCVRSQLIKLALLARLPSAARLLGHRSGSWPY